MKEKKIDIVVPGFRIGDLTFFLFFFLLIIWFDVPAGLMKEPYPIPM